MKNGGSNLVWTVYIIKTIDEKLYTGITTDLKRRFSEHLNGGKKAKFFHLSKPEMIVFQENYPCRSSASKRECEIKRMSRKQKLEMIEK